MLERKEKERMNACVELSQQPQAIITLENKMRNLYRELGTKNPWYLAHIIFPASSDLKTYSANDLYYMTETQRNQIALEYSKLYNNALEKKKELKRELRKLEAQEQEEIRQKNERIRQEKRAEKQRQKALREQIRAQETAQQAEDERIKREQQAELNSAQEKQKKEAIKAQDAELKKYNDQKKEDDLIAGQQAILDECAQQKALLDAVKHKAALEKQQEYIPMDLQPSAPSMEKNKTTAAQCLQCGGKAPSKPLPCVKCKKKVESICPTCIKQYAGRCPHCFELKSLGIEKEKGECCIGVAACTEEKGVTVIPCKNCKKASSTDRICTGCLQACIDNNNKKELTNKCPRCAENALDADLAEKILTQQK